LTPNDNNVAGRQGFENAPPLVDIPALAKRLSVPERHVRRLVAENRIPYLKWGHLVRFDPRQIEAWLEGARVPASPALALGKGRPRRGRVAPKRPLKAVGDNCEGSGEAVVDEVDAGIGHLVEEHLRRLHPPAQDAG
jgi:excisionase family DNA binding protein